MPAPFIVLMFLILLIAFGIWFVLARIFTKIGESAEKAAKPFEQLKEGEQKENDNKHEV